MVSSCKDEADRRKIPLVLEISPDKVPRRSFSSIMCLPRRVDLAGGAKRSCALPFGLIDSS